MTLDTINTIALQVGLSSDWSLGKPPWVDEQAHEVDREIATTAICPVCSRLGLQHCSFFRVTCGEPGTSSSPQARQYRCFARCEDCGAVEEF